MFAFLSRIRKENKSAKYILVTSDSKSFLQIVSNSFSFVHTIPGEIFHPDYSQDSGKLSYIKSFVDMFMISHARKAYNYSTGMMLSSSGFAKNAARIGGVEYEHVHE